MSVASATGAPKCTKVMRPLTSVPISRDSGPVKAQPALKARASQPGSRLGARPQKTATGSRSMSVSPALTAASMTRTSAVGRRRSRRSPNTPRDRSSASVERLARASPTRSRRIAGGRPCRQQDNCSATRSETAGSSST